MKKVLLIAAVFIILITGVYLVASVTTEFFGDDGYAISDKTIERNLQSANATAASSKIDTVSFSHGDKITVSRLGTFVGQDNTAITDTYPLFIKNGEYVMTRTGNAKLISDDFTIYDAYPNMYLAGGRIFDENRVQTDEGYILMLLPNGLYLSAVPIYVETNLETVYIPQHSIFNPTQSFLSFYSLDGDKLEFSSATALGEASTILIGEDKYTYHGFLGLLGQVIEKVEEETPEDPFIEIPTEVRVDAEGQKIGDDGSYPPVENTDPGVVEPPEEDDGGDGGEIVPGGGSGTPAPYAYKKPSAEMGEFTSSVYGLQSSITITDFAQRMYKGVKVEAYIDGILHMRKSYVTNSDVLLTPLKPGSTFNVIAFFDYFDEEGYKRREVIYEGEHSTLDISNLTPLSFSLSNGEYLPTAVSFVNMEIEGGEEDNLEGATQTANAIYKCEVTVGSAVFSLPASAINAIKQSLTDVITARYVSGAVLGSDRSYDYSLKLYDRYGNVLPLVEEISGTTRTCKLPPEATVSISVNRVANVRFTISLTNDDDALLTNTYFTIYTATGEPVITRLEGASAPLAHFPLSEGTQTLVFPELDENAAYYVEVVSTYDTNDGKGAYANVVIGSAKLTTLPITALGYAFFTNEISNVTQTDAALHFALDTARTDATLMFLLDRIDFEVYAGATRVSGVSLSEKESGEAFAALKNGGEFTTDGYTIVGGVLAFSAEGLTPATDYSIAVTPYATQGTKSIAITDALSVSSFKTLRSIPMASVENVYTTEESIELFNVLVTDNDGAITSKVTLQLRDALGALVATAQLTPNETVQRTRFTGLNANEVYTVSFFAQSVNFGYINSAAQINYRFAEQYTITARSSVTGKVSILGLFLHDEETGELCGQNLFDRSTITKYTYINTKTGAFVSPSGSFYCSALIPVTEGSTYSMRCFNNTSTGTPGYLLYDGAGNTVRVSETQHAYGLITIPEGVTHIQISGYSPLIDNACFSLSSSPTVGKNATATINISLDDIYGIVDGSKYEVRVFKNNVRAATIQNSYITGDTVSDVITHDMNTDPIKPDTWRFELWVSAFDYEIRLDSFEFEARGQLYGIANAQQLRGIDGGDLYGNYIVTADIYTSTRTDCPNIQSFWGTIDFDGHTLYFHDTTDTASRYIVGTLYRDAVIKNFRLVVGTPLLAAQPVYIANANHGIISDFVVELSGSVHKPLGISGNPTGAIFYVSNTQFRTSIIRNFSIDFGGDFYAGGTERYGAVVVWQRGLVEHGRIFGGDLYISCNYAAFVSGFSYETSITRDIIVEGNIYARTSAPERRVLLIAYSTGRARIENCIAVGDAYRLNDATGAYDVCLDMSIAGISADIRNVYQRTDNVYSARAGVNAISLAALHNIEWYKSVLMDNGSSFSLDPVASGYYPTVVMDESAPAQRPAMLPALERVNETSLETIVVTEQYDDYAIAQFSFINAAGYAIREIAVEYLSANVISQSTVDGISTVTVRLSPYTNGEDPTKYISRYNVLSFTRATEVVGIYTTVFFDEGDHTVDAEFFKPVSDDIDWANISSDVTQNYRLTNDLYLEALSARDTILYRNNTTFSGKLDGAGFTVYNADLGKTYSRIFNYVTGTIKNITFDNIHNLISSHPYTGLIAQVNGNTPDCLITNVCVRNSTFAGTTYAGALVGYANGGTFEYCSSINNKLTLTDSAATTINFGGLIGRAHTSLLVTNSFVSNVFIDGSGATQHYAGGFAGYVYQSRFENCYATGEIFTDAANAAGFAGITDLSVYESCWADVMVNSKESLLGGFSNGASEYFGSIALGDVASSALDDFVYRFRGDTDVETAGTYALSTQKINRSVSADRMGVVALLTENDLRDATIYTELLGWDESDYDFSGITNYLMPKLVYADGTLIPGQPNCYFSLGDIAIKTVSAGSYNGEYLVHVELKHPETVRIDGVTFDYLNVEITAETHNPTTTIFDFRVSNMTRMLDTYLITSLSYTAEATTHMVEVSETVDFGEIFYNEIGSAAEWQAVMAERGDNYENFLITGDIDFGTISDEIVRGVKLNRLEGIGIKTISNATLVSNGDNGIKGLINAISGKLANINFENINTTKISSRPRNGIISQLTGEISNVKFIDCAVSSVSYYTGCIGAISAALVKNVELDNVTVTSTTQYTGTLTGTIRYVELNTVTVKNCEVTGQSYTGGVAGILPTVEGNLAHLVRVEDSAITGYSYVGGVAGGTNPLSATEEKCPNDIVVTRCNITGTGSIVSGVNCYGSTRDFGTMEDYENGLYGISVTYCNITGKGATYGISGKTASTSDTYRTAFNYVAHNTIESLEGGAYGLCSSYSHYSLSEHNLIIGATEAAGGSRGASTNCVSRNNRIFGSYNVGGLSSYSVMWNSISADNIISTIHDDLFTQVTGREKVGVTDHDIQNKNIGGVLGNASSYYCYDSIAVNCTIGAEGATNVGGVVGGCAYSPGSYAFKKLVSMDCVIFGSRNVGGIAGVFASRELYRCISNSEIRGEYNVGGIIGYLDTSLTAENTKLTRVCNSYFTGEVSGYSDVGGLYGASSYILDATRAYGLLLAGHVSAIVSENAYAVGNGLEQMTNSRMFVGSTLNGGAVGTLPAGMLPVTSAELANKTTYTAAAANGGLGWTDGTVYFSYAGLSYGFMPIVTRDNVPMPYQEGKDASGVYYSVTDETIDGGIPIPQNTAPISPRVLAAVDPGARLPSMSYYASGADLVNLEFDCINPAAFFEIYVGDTALITSNVSERVYTVRYDYSAPLRVVVSFFDNTEEYFINPSSLKQVFSLWQDGWYILTDDGIQCKKEMLFGEFRNLYKNEALAADGNVYDVTDGTLTRTSGEPVLVDSVPLWQFSYEGAQILTYYGFSISDGTLNEGIRLMVKDGELFALNASKLYDHTGLVADVNLGLKYLTVLLEDGGLLNINTPLVLPEGFELEYGSSNIAEMSCNLDSSLSYLFIRYTSGRMVAFDYLTGESLDISLPAPSMPLLAYVGDFIGRSLVAPTAASGYTEIVEVVENITSEDPKLLATLGVGEGGKIAADGASNADGTGDGKGTAGQNKYSTVYDVETDSFKVFEQTELIAETKAVSVDTKLKETEIFVRLYGDETAPTLEMPDFNLTGGGVIMISVALVIFILLVGLYLKFRKARARRKNEGE